MKRIIQLCAWLALGLNSACHGVFPGSRPEVEVELYNRSATEMRDARVFFGGFACDWGNLGPTFSKSYLAFPHPITAEARLEWQEQGRLRSERLDLRGVYAIGQSGCLTFTVAAGRVTVAFKPRPSL
jgi:hypothetical protein